MVEKSEKVVLSMGTPQQRGRTEQQDVSKMTVVELKRALQAMKVEFTREDKKATLVALFKAHASPPTLSRNNSGGK